MENQRKNKSSRGAIAAGVFVALYLVTYVIVGAICMPVAVLFLFMPEVVALLAAPTYHMMLTKSPSGIPIFIVAVVPSLILIATGHNPIAPLVSIPVAIVAILIARAGRYKSFTWNTISHLIFSWNLFGGFIPIWVMRDYFFQTTLEGGMSQEFCDAVRAWTPWWMLPVMLAVTVITTSEIAFGCENHGLPPEEIQRRVAQTAEDLNIGPLLDRNIFQLSGGEKQKIAFASIYAINPSIYVLDEPSSNLDCYAIRELHTILKLLKSQGKTIILAEHRT